jgi:hypothetical protein
MLISAIKLIVPIGIMLLCNTAAPLTANALLLSDGDDMFLPVPRQSFPTSYDSMNTSIPSPNRVQVSQRSNLIFTPHQLLIPSHPIGPNRVQFLPSSDSSIRNGSDNSYYNNLDSWTKRTPYDLWKPLNIPKNLIVPQACLLDVCPAIVGIQRGDIIIANAVNNARIFGLGGNDIIECGIGNCNVFTGFGNNVLMSGPSTSAHLFAGSGGYFRPGNNIFIGGGGVTLMVGGNGNDQFYAGSNRLFSGGNDIMIGGSGANYFDCGPNGNGVILDFNPAKGDIKSPDCKYVITTYSNNIFGPGIHNVFPGPGLFPGQNLNQNGVNNTAVANTGNGTSVVTTHNRVPSSH